MDNRIDAIYGRQSIDKKDSISIESQFEFCRYELKGGEAKEYKDKGYSGKNIERPDFQRLLKDIRAGLIRRVIVYKLDRISRSIVDFAKLMELFKQYNVEFVSCTEKFDTSTPMGRAMLNICIVFAQLERESIQMRVQDAFYSRCAKGYYMRGRAPYGFDTEPIVMDGIKTKRLVENAEMDYAELMYEMYAEPENSYGDINMKRNAILTVMLLLVLFTFSACASAISNNQATKDSNITENGASTGRSDYDNTSTPEFFNDLGKTLDELKNEHPEDSVIVRPDGFPDSAAVCFGASESEYLYCFFGTQSGDAEKAMSEYENQLKCAGFITTAEFLFSDMDDDMSFQDFFAMIGIDDYEYFGEDADTVAAEGWLSFTYHGMDVMVNTNEAASGGGWNFTGAEIVKHDAPVSIVDTEVFNANQDLADKIIFD